MAEKNIASEFLHRKPEITNSERDSLYDDKKVKILTLRQFFQCVLVTLDLGHWRKEVENT